MFTTMYLRLNLLTLISYILSPSMVTCIINPYGHVHQHYRQQIAELKSSPNPNFATDMLNKRQDQTASNPKITIVTPSPGADPIIITSQFQTITSYTINYSICPLSSSPTTTTTTPTPCTTKYAPTQTPICATVLPALVSAITISRCDQAVAVSSASATVPLALLGPAAPHAPHASDASPSRLELLLLVRDTTFFAPWTALLDGRAPSTVVAVVCIRSVTVTVGMGAATGTETESNTETETNADTYISSPAAKGAASPESTCTTTLESWTPVSTAAVVARESRVRVADVVAGPAVVGAGSWSVLVPPGAVDLDTVVRVYETVVGETVGRAGLGADAGAGATSIGAGTSTDIGTDIGAETAAELPASNTLGTGDRLPSPSPDPTPAPRFPEPAKAAGLDETGTVKSTSTLTRTRTLYVTWAHGRTMLPSVAVGLSSQVTGLKHFDSFSVSGLGQESPSSFVPASLVPMVSSDVEAVSSGATVHVQNHPASSSFAEVFVGVRYWNSTT